MKNSHSESYAAAGVDVTAGYEAVNRIKPLVESTYIPGVMGSLGGFGGLFAPNVAGMKKPVLVWYRRRGHQAENRLSHG